MKDLTQFDPPFKTLIGFLTGKDFSNLTAILRFVSDETHVTIDDIRSKSRKREFVEARNIYVKRAKMLFPEAKPGEIAEPINRSRTTGYYSDCNVDEIPSLRKKYNELFAE